MQIVKIITEFDTTVNGLKFGLKVVPNADAYGKKVSGKDKDGKECEKCVIYLRTQIIEEDTIAGVTTRHEIIKNHVIEVESGEWKKK